MSNNPQIWKPVKGYINYEVGLYTLVTSFDYTQYKVIEKKLMMEKGRNVKNIIYINYKRPMEQIHGIRVKELVIGTPPTEEIWNKVISPRLIQGCYCNLEAYQP